ncbi:transcription-repair coupling factor [Bacillaceae bacterium]
MKGIIGQFTKDSDFNAIVTGLEKGLKEQLAAGLSGSARQLFLASLYRATGRTQLVVTHNMLSAQKIYEDLVEFLSEEEVLLFPANELIAAEIVAASPETLGQRLEVLRRLSQGFRGIVIVPYIGLRKLLPPKTVWASALRALKQGQELDVEEFLQYCVTLGYERVEMVEKKGELSVRGGIIDIFPYHLEQPVRLELFDVEIDSLRFFDPDSQRSLQPVEEVVIAPTSELFGSKEQFQQAAVRLQQRLSEALEKVRKKEVKERLLEKIGFDIERLKEGARFPGISKYISLFYPDYQNLSHYVPEGSLIVLDEPSRIQETDGQLEKEEGEWKTTLLEQGEYIGSLPISYTYDEIMQGAKMPVLYLSLFLRQIPKTQPQNIVNFNCKMMQNFHGQIHVLKAEMERWKKAQAKVVFLAADEERVKRLQRVLEDYQLEADLLHEDTFFLPDRPVILKGNLQTGFELPLTRLVVITETEVFTQKLKKARKVKPISNAERIKSYLELQPGDYVVHVNHGIGRYVGIETLEINGIHKDYLHIKYAGNDKLYVPIEQIDLVQKYVGSEDKEPKIYHLGGNEWKRVKAKVQSSVRDIAADLVKLYAQRQATVGYAFSKDTPEQREFEALFPYQETPDQLRAIEEVKRDMESPRPMDRLLCGDVGYGKTEVAIRAAFKAAIEGKQVAVLVPTTILAQQHYETFRERFADYPFKIDVLSRFRSRKEQAATIKGLKDGTIDIVIGTHRLLSKDVQFKDLGLLVVDEEQRFGVSHKEKLKKLKTNVDVLTLTATPIPRTLHMAMIGVRDLSVIETPPENRFPVQTYVMEYSSALVREAIERELARGGQVYFLYNQVKGIQQMADQIRILVPEARVAVAHGQMSETELESVMLDFLDGEYDVLVSTTIIETGVDIPNVNTLIIYNADKMGLSQLYQLRGRVGRSNRIAYAYFTYQPNKTLSEAAEKRLQAIKEFTELGSGFKIAMRDLAIRGAGNLLGPEQHGFIASVGFDLYSQMLKEAIEELKGEEKKEEPVKPEIDLNLDAYIPSAYIPDEKQKIEMYKKLAAAATLKDVEDVTDELIDRFGAIPLSVEYLLAIARLKAYAMQHNIVQITKKDEQIQILFHERMSEEIDGGRLFALAGEFGKRIGLFTSGQQIGITVKVNGMTNDELLTMLQKLLAKLDRVRKTKGELKHAAN